MWRITILAIIIPLVFWGCVNQNYPVTETYTETEYRTEYKTAIRTEVQKETIRTGEDLLTAYGWYNQGTTSGKWGYLCTNPPFWYFNYSIPSHSITSIEVMSNSQYPQILAYAMERIEEFGRSMGDIPAIQEQRYCEWLNEYNYKINGSRLIGNYNTGNDPILLKIDTTGIRSLSIVVTGNTGSEFSTFSSATLKWAETRDKEVTKEETVQVKVPITVEKQRTVIKTRRVPFWEAFSGK